MRYIVSQNLNYVDSKEVEVLYSIGIYPYHRKHQLLDVDGNCLFYQNAGDIPFDYDRITPQINFLNLKRIKFTILSVGGKYVIYHAYSKEVRGLFPVYSNNKITSFSSLDKAENACLLFNELFLSRSFAPVIS